MTCAGFLAVSYCTFLECKAQGSLRFGKAAGRLVSQLGQKRHDCDLHRSRRSSDVARKILSGAVDDTGGMVKKGNELQPRIGGPGGNSGGELRIDGMCVAK